MPVRSRSRGLVHTTSRGGRKEPAKGTSRKRRLVVSRFALLTWERGTAAFFSPVTGLSAATTSVDLVLLVHAFATPRAIDEVVGRSRARRRAVDALLEAGI